MKDLIEDWRQNAERKSSKTFAFLTRLKMNQDSSLVDEVAKEAHKEIFSQIKCTDCANCCKTLSPQINQADITRISSFLRISKAEFIKTYLKIGNENEYEMNALPCPFLKNDKCDIYEVRPADCSEYPHTDKNEFTSRRYTHTANTEACPAVYHILETMKIKFSRRNKK